MESKNLSQYDDMYSYPFLWWVKKKFVREWHQFLYKLRFKKRTTEYLGMSLVLPLTNWVGKYLVVPNEFFMSKCIHASLLMKKGVAIDIGTHAGEFLIRYKTACKTLGINEGKYYGFEPNYASFSFINELIGANDWSKNCNVLPVALANSDELKTFYASRYADPCSSIHPEVNKGTTCFSTTVPTYKADGLLKQLDIDNIAIIKIDAEGAELDILKGLNETIKKFQPCIHCELANIPPMDDPNYQFILDNNRNVIQEMKNLGYESYSINEDGGCYHQRLKFRNYLPTLSGPVEATSIPPGGNYIMAHKEDMPELLSYMTK